jgi:hypothetical protein
MVMNHITIKPGFSTLIGHRGCVGDSWEMMIKFILKEEYDLRFLYFGGDAGFDLGQRDELLALVKEQRFDLIIVYSYLSLVEERRLFASIKAQCGKPIIVSNMGALALSEVHEAGVDVFLPMAFTVDELRNALADCGVKAHA